MAINILHTNKNYLSGNLTQIWLTKRSDYLPNLRFLFVQHALTQYRSIDIKCWT